MNLQIAAIVNQFLEHVPDRIPGPGEVEQRLAGLAERYPNQVSRRPAGVSRSGTPITVTSIGSGNHDALVVAGSHPNELVGLATVLCLAEALCAHGGRREELGYRWHLIGCIDPDGARLNEGCYSGPITRRGYHQGFYRPSFENDVEWSCPVPGQGETSPLPETRALMRVIHNVRPRLLCSLHDAEFGGMYVLVSDDRPGMADVLAAVPARSDLPVHIGDIDDDVPDARPLGTGVFLIPPEVTAPDGDRRIISSLNYAARLCGTFGLVTEVPMWPDSRSQDTTPCGQRLADVLRDTAGLLDDVSPLIGKLTDPAVSAWPDQDESRFGSSLDQLRNVCEKVTHALRARAGRVGDVQATVADRLTTRQLAHTLRGRTCGTALRVLDARAARGGAADLHAARTELHGLFQAWAAVAEADSPDTPAPLTRLVHAQLGAILGAANQLNVIGSATSSGKEANSGCVRTRRCGY